MLNMMTRLLDRKGVTCHSRLAVGLGNLGRKLSWHCLLSAQTDEAQLPSVLTANVALSSPFATLHE